MIKMHTHTIASEDRKRIIADTKRLGITDVSLEYSGGSFVRVNTQSSLNLMMLSFYTPETLIFELQFKSKEDMHLYKLYGEYAEVDCLQFVVRKQSLLTKLRERFKL